jgi:hypothetical protein
VVNDSHAEIVARRGFMRFCYDQIQLVLSDKEEIRKKSIFVVSKGQLALCRPGQAILGKLFQLSSGNS